MRRFWRSALTPVCGGLIGGAFNLFISGTRLADPREFAWLMKHDWRIHFLGWHFFRNEPWHWPPGRIESFHAPDGTAIAFTDSIPLVALPLKLFSSLLPTPFQYIGLWLLVCFVLQGVFGVLITRVWTRNPLHQLLGAALFVTIPTLLIRAGHPALCAHFVILWALWIYLRSDASSSPSFLEHGALGSCVGLVHPYLAVMALALIAARVVRDRHRRAVVAGAVACAACLAGWWASGLFTVTGAENLASEGLGFYSMNVLSPITPSGWSTYLPELPVATPGQYEGFQYFGLGLLFLIALAVLVLAAHVRTIPWRTLLPLLTACMVLAAYAIGPRVTVGANVLVDWSSPRLEQWALFRATGRFFWPMAYVAVAGAIGAVSRLAAPMAAILLAAAFVVQLADLRRPYLERREASRSEAFHSWGNALPSPVWHELLPFYKHVVLAPPRQCGRAPIGFESPAYLAGLHGLTINSAEVARFDESKRRQYCSRLVAEIVAGTVDDQSLYILDTNHAAALKAAARKPIACGTVDAAFVCVTADSYARWRHLTTLN